MTTSLLDTLRGGLIVSCQPVDNGPLDSIPAIVGFALAARDGGARALRIEGADNVAAVTKACDLPIIGIVKRDQPTSPVRINLPIRVFHLVIEFERYEMDQLVDHCSKK
ncbi:hypothetical protein [Devosia salina]|uniref:N-acylglucosamine-6-phosphate 2-epimerase n=1 Tax=Devosia salina TaxID=2860336 RepID=A0ABX8WCF6_9HYPH|nr:hypothetical protein [Devosia salina]QYO76619.1 hypothetical protein K1X15_18875 [Devosia salina]